MDLKVFEEYNTVLEAGFTRKPDDSVERRSAMAEEAAKKGGLVIKANLVHGKDVALLDEAAAAAIKEAVLAGKQETLAAGHPVVDLAPGYGAMESVDALITALPGITLTSTHGDCVPLWYYDPVHRAIGVAHAGWKGTLLGVAGETVRAMTAAFGTLPEDLKVYIGPAIGPCHFEVDRDVADAFTEALPWSSAFIRPCGKKFYIDLKAVNGRHLALAGVQAPQVGISDHCTYCMEKEYYSYRRSKDTARMLAYITLR